MSTQIIATIDPDRSRTDAQTANGQPISLDADPPEGDDSAPAPTETLLAALAGCTGMDVASLLRKKRQQATSYQIAVTGETADEHPKVFTTITVEHRVRGSVQVEALRRSIELSATRYCPLNAMLSASVTVEHRYDLNGEDGTSARGLVVVTGPEGARLA